MAIQIRRVVRTTTFIAAAALGVPGVSAQPAYPVKPLRIIVPYASGAGPDFTAREISRAITEATGQPVVTDNRPGAAATLGHHMGAKAAPDGYTLILGTLGGLVSGPALLGGKNKINPIMNKWLQLPDTLQRFQVAGLEVATTTPQGYHDQIRSDLDMWRKLIKESKITVDSLP